MTACPTCRRELLESQSECPRCGCELETVRLVESAARRLVRTGCRHLIQQRFEDALTVFEQAWTLRHTEEAARGRAVALLCAGRYSAALRGECVGETTAATDTDIRIISRQRRVCPWHETAKNALW